MRLARLGALILFIPLLVGCTSLTDAWFVVHKLEEPAIAAALTEQGIEEYNLAVLRRREYERLPEVEKYFDTALRYDPLNAQARQYLDRLNEFRETKVREGLQEARDCLARGERAEEDEYRLQTALQTVIRLDPDNKEAGRLLRKTARERSALVDLYLQRGRELSGQAETETSPESREALTFDAYRNAERAVAVDPRRGGARELRDSLQLELARIFDQRLQAIAELIEAGEHREAGRMLAAVDDLYGPLGGAFEKRMEALALEARVVAQEEQADRASAARAPVVRRRADPGPTFEESLQAIERLITEGDLAGAGQRIDLLARKTKAERELAALEACRVRLRSRVRDFYDRAVAAYRAERFREAIGLLQVVVRVDAGYELAEDYLQKAETKQKLLDQY